MGEGFVGKYVKPDNIKNDMGGICGKFDERMKEIFELLPYIPETCHSFLDIGFGGGQIAYYFLEKGKKVSSIGLELESYGIDVDRVRSDGIDLIDANIEKIPFDDHCFDCIIASHILEHIYNLKQAIDEIKRVLKREGVLVIFIPKYTDNVCAGHVNIGWNLGQLIYVLTTLGFDTKKGRFIEHGYSLCAMVSPSKRNLPILRGDRGDIQLLNDGGHFPFHITAGIDGIADGFYGGNIVAVNWEDCSSLVKCDESVSHIFLIKICRILKKLMGIRFSKLVYVMNEIEHPKRINPKNV